MVSLFYNIRNYPSSLSKFLSLILYKKLFFSVHSGGDTETDSEVEDRVDGVKSWLSKNKGSNKTQSDEGSLKSSRLVLMPSCIMSNDHLVIKLPTFH